MLKRITCIIVSIMLCVSVTIPVMASTDFAVSYISENDGEILCTLGEIEIEFTDSIDIDTLSGITFTKADESEIKGGAYVLNGEEDNQVIVKFGRLEKGEYVLCITEDLKSAGGESAIYSRYEYSVLTDKDAPVAYSNYSDIELGETDVETLISNGENISFSGAQEYSYVVDETSKGEKYINYTCVKKTASAGGGSTVTLPEAIEDGKVIVDLGVKADSGNMTRNLFTLRSSGTSKIYTFSISNTNDLGSATQGDYKSGGFTGEKRARDEDGFWNLRLSVKRADKNDAWSYEVYDKNTSLDKPIYKISIPSSKLENINSIIVFDVYNMTTTPASIMLKDIVVTMPRTPSVIYTNGENGEPGMSEISLVCNEDLDPRAVTNENISFVNQTGEKEECEILLDENKREIIIKPYEYLSYDGEYSVLFENQMCKNVSFKIASQEIEVNSVEYLNDENKISVSINNDTGETKKVIVVVSVVDAEGNIQFLPEVVAEDDADITAEIELTDHALPESGKFKVYIIQKCDDFLRFISDAHTIEF